MNLRIIVVAAALAVAGLTILLWSRSSPNARGGNENRSNVNQSVLNANLGTSPSAVSVADLTGNPEQYDDRSVCVKGYYQGSFEFAALAQTYRTVDGRNHLVKPYVWTALDESQYSLQCSGKYEGGCFGEVEVCGMFRYAASGEQGFGHVAAYRYALYPPGRE